MRSIADRNCEISDTWRARVEVSGEWKRSSSQAGGLLDVDTGGESKGFFIELEELPGRRAYLKPLKRHAWKRAAREKIASDLAAEILVRVPPVLLAVNGKVPDAERYACVSLLMYPHQFSWGQLKQFLVEGDDSPAAELLPLLAVPAARALAFDTWVGQTDHGDHPSNIVFGYEGTDYQQGEFIFLDYAFSMGAGGNWNSEGFRGCTPAPFPPRMRAIVSPDVMDEAISHIESLRDELVEDVVNRIPWQWLPDEEKDLILSGLRARRTMVRTALGGYL